MADSIPSIRATGAGPDGAGYHSRMAISHVPSHVRLWLITVLGLWADLWTKDWAFRTLDHDRPKVIIQNLLHLQLSLNPGALFGIGAGLAPIFVGASVLALLFVLYLFANSPVSRWSMHVGLGMVLAGAVGNLYDRTTQEAFVAKTRAGRDIGVRIHDKNDRFLTLADFPDGTNIRNRIPVDKLEPGSGPQPVVRDFIKIEAKVGRFALWPWIFNVADALLVVGVAALLLNFWFDRRHHAAEHSATPDPAKI